jgi:hypothetical protein
MPEHHRRSASRIASKSRYDRQDPSPLPFPLCAGAPAHNGQAFGHSYKRPFDDPLRICRQLNLRGSAYVSKRALPYLLTRVMPSSRSSSFKEKNRSSAATMIS